MVWKMEVEECLWRLNGVYGGQIAIFTFRPPYTMTYTIQPRLNLTVRPPFNTGGVILGWPHSRLWVAPKTVFCFSTLVKNLLCLDFFQQCKNLTKNDFFRISDYGVKT